MSTNPQSILLAKCSTTLFCLVRAIPLWAVAIGLLLLATLRNRLVVAAKPTSTTTATATARTTRKRSSSPGAELDQPS
jgi:hypothetical protein